MHNFKRIQQFLTRAIRRYRSRFIIIIAISFIAIFSFNRGKNHVTERIIKNELIHADEAENGISININLYSLLQPNDFDFECIKTKKVVVQTTICIHNDENDAYISKTLKKGEIWEEDLLTTFMRMLKADAHIHALDIGAQLGQYCLFAAKFGRKCVAVEVR